MRWRLRGAFHVFDVLLGKEVHVARALCAGFVKCQREISVHGLCDSAISARCLDSHLERDRCRAALSRLRIHDSGCRRTRQCRDAKRTGAALDAFNLIGHPAALAVVGHVLHFVQTRVEASLQQLIHTQTELRKLFVQTHARRQNWLVQTRPLRLGVGAVARGGLTIDDIAAAGLGVRQRGFAESEAPGTSLLLHAATRVEPQKNRALHDSMLQSESMSELHKSCAYDAGMSAKL